MESICTRGEQINGRYRDLEAQEDTTIQRYIVISLNISEVCIYRAKSTSILEENTSVHMVKCFDTHVKGGDCWYSFDY